MKLQSGTIEKVFIPIVTAVILSGISASVNIYTQLKILETKVSINNQRINTIFKKLDDLKEGQEEILKILIDWGHRK